MDPLKSMTAQEVKDYFSATYEFQVKEEGENLRVSFTDSGKTTSILMWNNPEALSIQQLIRIQYQLVWNHCHNIF